MTQWQGDLTIINNPTGVEHLRNLSFNNLANIEHLLVINKALEIGLLYFGALVFGPLEEYFGAFVYTFSVLSIWRSDPDPFEPEWLT